MKGYISLWFYNYKKLFIGCGIAYLILIILLPIVSNIGFNSDDNKEFYLGILVILAGVAAIIPGESLGKFLEKNLSLKFADYLLGCAKTPAVFVLSYALVAFICFAVVTALCAVYVGAAYLVTGGIIDAGALKLLLTIMLLAYSMNYCAFPLILKTKSEEKAGLIIGIVIGVLITPVCIAASDGNREFIEPFLNMLKDFYNSATFFPIFAGVLILICVLCSLISLKIIKRGDVC